MPLTTANGRTAKQILEDRIDDLVEPLNSTDSTAIHELYVHTTMGRWYNFEKEVRQCVSSTALRNVTLSHIPHGLHSANHVLHEQLFCGDEASVQARFNANVCHPVTSVCQSAGINCRFGDAKSSTDRDLGGIPDILCISQVGEALFVREVKTPWAHALNEAIEDDAERRNFLGQIAKYMFHSMVKYAFMTTYEHTVFLKQEAYPSIPGRHVLWFSRPIKSKTKSQQLSSNPSEASSYYDKTSVREAFFYLVSEVGAGRWQYTNNMETDKWYCKEVYHSAEDIDDVLDDQDA